MATMTSSISYSVSYRLVYADASNTYYAVDASPPEAPKPRKKAGRFDAKVLAKLDRALAKAGK
jgi:hypothetical protein